FDMQVSNAQLGQTRLKPLAVDKRIFAATHPTAAANVAKEIDLGFLKGVKEICFTSSINANGYNAGESHINLLSNRLCSWWSIEVITECAPQNRNLRLHPLHPTFDRH